MKIDRPFVIDPDIRRASTLPASVYRDGSYYALQCERLFPRAWHVVPEADVPMENGYAIPFVMLPDCLDEPLVLTRDLTGDDRVLSNVCTHRGNLVVTAPGPMREMRCRYHGRRFRLSGGFKTMPEFEDVDDFPSARDDLPRLASGRWGPLFLASLDPARSLADLMAPIAARVGWMPLDRFVFDAGTSRDYDVDANWALYCDNFLEGFHIPFVHEGLNAVLDFGTYRTETFGHGSLQIGMASDDDGAFDLPADHPDGGQRVAAFYFWLFPNLMLNFYPWGLSLNIVEPRGVDRCLVRFRSYVLDGSRRSAGAGADLHTVELEDEDVVRDVQRGVRSRLYDRGRYSPTREQGVHHFHRLLAEAMFD